MPVVKPVREIVVNDFKSFCDTFNIKSAKISGNDGNDEELIIEELNKIKNQKWIIEFIEDFEDGFFQLKEIS